MIPLEQKYLHIQGKQHGDCWRTCIASILECDINVFSRWELKQTWQEYYPIVLKELEKIGYKWGQYTVENTDQDCLEKYSIDGYVIAIGRSPRSTKENRINHAVVWDNGIVHDPHPDNTGILDIITFEVLMKIKI